MIRKLALAMFIVALPTSLISTTSNAQLAIEKAFVAKSKLHNSIWKKHDPASTIEVDHSAWDAFLAKYLKKDARGVNLLAYKSVTSGDKKLLADYLIKLQSVDVTKLNKNEQYAFWLNLYNSSTVNVALENYPIKSILDIKSNPLDLKGPFNDKIAKVNGQTLTLDTIESGIVRPIWPDPRLHYGFNCAAISCPNLSQKAFTGNNLDQQLNRLTTAFINDPRGVEIIDGKIVASKIFFWYSQDYGGEKGILKHIQQYAVGDLKQKLVGQTKIHSYIYDWKLNER